jgi:hypothetical protein
VGSSNSFGDPPNIANLPDSNASGILSAKFLTKFCKVWMKLLIAGSETGFDETPWRRLVEISVWKSGLGTGKRPEPDRT